MASSSDSYEKRYTRKRQRRSRSRSPPRRSPKRERSPKRHRSRVDDYKLQVRGHDKRRYRSKKHADQSDEEDNRQKPKDVSTKPKDPNESLLAAGLSSNLIEEASKRIEEEVERRVSAAMESESVGKQIEVRLREERAKLEEAVSRQVEEERLNLLAMKRREQEERQRQREQLEKILEDNQKKVDAAWQKTEQEREMRKNQRLQQSGKLSIVNGVAQTGEEDDENQYQKQIALKKQQIVGQYAQSDTSNIKYQSIVQKSKDTTDEVYVLGRKSGQF